MSYKIAQLVQTSSRNTNTISDVFIAQPDSIRENLGGKLFILVEINPKKNESIKIANFLVDNLNHNYYQNEKIILRERLSSLKVESIFEAAIAKTNKNFLEYLESEKLRINFDNINITAGIIHEDFIHFTSSGNNKVFLVYKNEKQGGEYKITDILKKSNETDKTAKVKLFDNVISGKIPEKGNFIITNEALPEYISSKQLIEIVTSLPPASAAEQIKNTLLKINSYVPFLAIIIKSTMLSAIDELQKVVPQTSSESIIDLNRTEDSTESLLTPSGIININKWLRLAGNFFNRDKASALSANQLSLKEKIFMKKRSFEWFKKITDVCRSILLIILNSIVALFKILTSKEKILFLYSTIKNKSIYFFSNTITIYKNLGKQMKAMLFICLICLVLFLFNTFYIKSNNDKTETENKYVEITKSIEEKQNKAEANLLYNNEEGAKQLFGEIETLMQEMPQQTEEQKTQYNMFKEKFDAQMEKIRHVVKIDNAEEVVNLNTTNGQAKPDNFTLFDNKIFIADASQKSIYIYSTADKKTTTYTELVKNINILSTPVLTKNNTIYYYNKDSIVEFDTKKESITIFPIAASSFGDFSGISLYNNKLYLYNNSNIYRSDRSGQGFSAPTTWLKEQVDVNGATGMVIDGNIYLLKNNGEILKLLSGKKVDFTLSDPEPKLESPTKLIIANENYYILEPKNKRLVVYDKNGQFVSQYKADKFDNLKDFTIDEKNKTIYFLNNTSIYKVTY